MIIRPIDRHSNSDRASWARLRLRLWDDLDPMFNEADMTAFEQRIEQQVLLAFAEVDAGAGAGAGADSISDASTEPIGFAEVALRNLVDGCLTSPVGYLEAIYVEPSRRGQGAGRALLDAAIGWAREQGCTEFATDSDLSDLDAQSFHLANGFAETFRIVQFRREI